MRVVILTSSRIGTASFFLPYLVSATDIEIVSVILSKNILTERKIFYRKKLKKILKIGLGGAVNGIRIRKWFTVDVNRITGVHDIEDICKANYIPFFETDDINNDFTAEQVKLADADIGVSLGNGYITYRIFSIPRYGMVNMHGEVLPAFQNAQSVIWQLYEGSSTTGYTIHKINKGIDTGDILKQETFPIVLKKKLSETVAFSCAEIQRRAAIGMVEVLQNIDNYLSNAIKQGKGKSYTTPTLWQFIQIYINHCKLLKKESVNG